MTLSSADIKREILKSAGASEIKSKVHQNPQGISDGEYIEWGNALEQMTKMAGWIWLESYMLRRMNLIGLVVSDKIDPDQKGIAKGYIELMQTVQTMIEKKDELLTKEKIRHEEKSRVSENEGE